MWIIDILHYYMQKIDDDHPSNNYLQLVVSLLLKLNHLK